MHHVSIDCLLPLRLSRLFMYCDNKDNSSAVFPVMDISDYVYSSLGGLRQWCQNTQGVFCLKIKIYIYTTNPWSTREQRWWKHPSHEVPTSDRIQDKKKSNNTIFIFHHQVYTSRSLLKVCAQTWFTPLTHKQTSVTLLWPLWLSFVKIKIIRVLYSFLRHDILHSSRLDPAC